MEFTNDELVFMIEALTFAQWPSGKEQMVDDLIEQFEDKLRDQRM